MDDTILAGLYWLTRGIEIAGVAIIALGIVTVGIRFLIDWQDPGLRPQSYHRVRAGIGRSILLGLELLVAADIINTVAIEPSLQSLAVLGGIVLIRTFLSLSLEVEIEGRWPWQRGADTRE